MKKTFFLLSSLILSMTINGQVFDFTMTSTNGTTYNLYNELDNGKTVVLDFFSTTCGSCQTSVPSLEHAWKEYFEEGKYGYVWSIEVAYRTDSVIDDFMNEYGGTFPSFSIINDDSVVNDTFGYYVPYTPYFYIICPNYKIHNISIDELDVFLKQCGVELSIEDELWSSTNIYANNNAIVFKNLPSQSQRFNLQLIDITGKQLLNKTLFNNSGEIKFPDKLNGMFFVRIYNEGAYHTTKIMIK